MIRNHPRNSCRSTRVLMVLMAMVGMVVALAVLNDNSKNSPARVFIPEDFVLETKS
ncbi:Hypothetical protein NGAL_HAMBI1145_53330 [Neorhizobium galegae bv. officinalis]|uniref:Uncharacterized protein n=1 Tax=Neorhizobium galegae bv. officinalis TaxID=323656 RepID=A0A0T7FZ69_NEOGA|nr:Hypothetical protein NGAL_HAMBI1145_53330 [Neorhizobium galegae bv. officinalis]